MNKLSSAADDLNEEAPEAHHVEAAFVETVLYVWTLYFCPTIGQQLFLGRTGRNHISLLKCIDICRPKANSPPQDMLLKIQREHMYVEEAKGSSLFVLKLGLAKLRCCLLMNGLVHESTEVSNFVSYTVHPILNLCYYYKHFFLRGSAGKECGLFGASKLWLNLACTVGSLG